MICFSNTAATAIPVMSYYKADLAILSVFQLSEVVEVLGQGLGGLLGFARSASRRRADLRRAAAAVAGPAVGGDREHLCLDRSGNGGVCAG